MSKLLQIYFIISFSLFTSVIAKLYTTSSSFFEAYVAVFEKKNYFIIVLNFVLAIGIMLIMLIQYYFMGDFLETEYKQAMNELHGFIVPIFMMMYYLNLEFVTFNFIALIFCRYLICLINVRVKSFSINYENSTAKSHRKMILLQFLLFLYCFDHLITHLKHHNDNPLNLALFNQYFLCCNFLFESIVNQLIIISDDQNGNSINAYYNRQHISYYGSLISAGISIITALVIIYSRISNKKFFLFFTLFDPLQSIFSKISSYKKWKKFCTDLNILLSSPTDEELQEHDTCIICRMKLTKNYAKKLPCGHIFHLDCMIVWFGTRQVCPICGADIHELLKQANHHHHHSNEEVNEDENENAENNEQIESQNDDVQYNFNDFDNNIEVLHEKKDTHRRRHRHSHKHDHQNNDEIQEKSYSFSDFDILDDDDIQQNAEIKKQNIKYDDFDSNLIFGQNDQQILTDNNDNNNSNYHDNAEIVEELRQTRELLKEFEQRVRFLEGKLQGKND